MKRTIWVLMGILIFIPIRTDAQVATRCGDDDKLLPDQVVGRNAWARKCGYIDAARESMLNSMSSYQIFSNGCFKYPCAGRNSNCANFVPASAFSPCVAGLIKIGTCYAEALTLARAEAGQACGPPDPHAQAAGETAQGPGLVKWPVELGVCGDFICGVGKTSSRVPRIVELRSTAGMVGVASGRMKQRVRRTASAETASAAATRALTAARWIVAVPRSVEMASATTTRPPLPVPPTAAPSAEMASAMAVRTPIHATWTAEASVAMASVAWAKTAGVARAIVGGLALGRSVQCRRFRCRLRTRPGRPTDALRGPAGTLGL